MLEFGPERINRQQDSIIDLDTLGQNYSAEQTQPPVGLDYFAEKYWQTDDQATINAALLTASLLRETATVIATGHDVPAHGMPSQRLLADVFHSIGLADEQEAGWGRPLFVSMTQNLNPEDQELLVSKISNISSEIDRYFPKNSESERPHIASRISDAAKIRETADELRKDIEQLVIAKHFDMRPTLHEAGHFDDIELNVYLDFISEAYMYEQIGVATDQDRSGIPGQINWKFKKDAELLYKLEELISYNQTEQTI